MDRKHCSQLFLARSIAARAGTGAQTACARALRAIGPPCRAAIAEPNCIRQITPAQGVTLHHRQTALDAALELAHVVRPVVIEQLGREAYRDPRRLAA